MFFSEIEAKSLLFTMQSPYGAYNMEEVSSDSPESPQEPNPPQNEPTESLFPPSAQPPEEPNLREMPLPKADSPSSIAIQGQVEVIRPTDIARKGVFVVKVRPK